MFRVDGRTLVCSHLDILAKDIKQESDKACILDEVKFDLLACCEVSSRALNDNTPVFSNDVMRSYKIQ